MRFVGQTVVALILAVAWDVPALPGTLDTLKPEHPRLLAHRKDFDRITELVKTDPLARRWYDGLKDEADRMLDKPVTQYVLRDGRRLLYESNDVQQRVLTLGLVYKLDGDRRYLDRIWADLEAAASFKDWNPDHFLDVAIMSTAFAIAYDWCYDDWSARQRKVIRAGLVRNGLEAGLLGYEREAWWTRTPINWNQVCNGGLILAALALADETPEDSARMIDLAVTSLPISMARYAPDGGYDEGPGYWGFGTMYNVLAIAALDSALGHDFGLGEKPGFEMTASFPMQMTGPTGVVFNFADCKERAPTSPTMLYFARRFHQPAYARFAAQHNVGSALDLLWYDPDLMRKDARPMPLAKVFQSARVGCLLGAGGDADAWYVAAKGGTIDHGHAQMDLGSFILESQGVRWLIDLGADDYNLPGYFDSGSARWRYYRNRAEGHNTLVVNPSAQPDQSRQADVTVELDQQTLRMDLSEVYPGTITRVLGLVPQRDAVVVTDRLDFGAPTEVWWFAHTRAAIELADDGKSAILRQNGKSLRAVLVSPAGARLVVMDATPLPTSPAPLGQNPNTGAEIENVSPGAKFVLRGQMPRYGRPDPSQAVRKVAIHVEGVTDETLEVRFENVRAMHGRVGR